MAKKPKVKRGERRYVMVRDKRNGNSYRVLTSVLGPGYPVICEIPSNKHKPATKGGVPVLRHDRIVKGEVYDSEEGFKKSFLALRKLEQSQSLSDKERSRFYPATMEEIKASEEPMSGIQTLIASTKIEVKKPPSSFAALIEAKAAKKKPVKKPTTPKTVKSMAGMQKKLDILAKQYGVTIAIVEYKKKQNAVKVSGLSKLSIKQFAALAAKIPNTSHLPQALKADYALFTIFGAKELTGSEGERRHFIVAKSDPERAKFLSALMKACSGETGKKLVAAFNNDDAEAFDKLWTGVSDTVKAQITASLEDGAPTDPFDQLKVHDTVYIKSSNKPTLRVEPININSQTGFNLQGSFVGFSKNGDLKIQCNTGVSTSEGNGVVVVPRAWASLDKPQTQSTVTASMEVANTILKQLGGNKFLSMTGARDLVGGKNSLQFGLPRGALNKANKVEIKLNSDDTYTLTFYKLYKLELKTLSTHKGLQADNLRSVFTDKTGFKTSLGTMTASITQDNVVKERQRLITLKKEYRANPTPALKKQIETLKKQIDDFAEKRVPQHQHDTAQYEAEKRKREAKIDNTPPKAKRTKTGIKLAV